MTDPEFNLLEKLESDGPLETYGRKPEHENAIAFDLCEKGLATYSDISKQGRNDSLFANLAISEKGRNALESERSKKKERSPSGVAKNAFLKSKPFLWLVVSTAVVFVITFYGSKILNARGETNRPPETHLEKHDTKEVPEE